MNLTGEQTATDSFSCVSIQEPTSPPAAEPSSHDNKEVASNNADEDAKRKFSKRQLRDHHESKVCYLFGFSYRKH